MIRMAENIAGSLDDALTLWMKRVEKLTSLSNVEKLQIALAGAQVFKDRLTEVVNTKHRSTHNDKVYGHAGDHVSIGMRDRGKSSEAFTNFNSYVVGWDNWYHAMNMLRANDGTKRQLGDHFLTNLRRDPELRSAILKAEKQKYNEIIAKHRQEMER